MDNKKITTLSFTLFLCLSFNISEPVPFVVPEGWPEPVYDFTKNPLTKEKIELGRHLFYDPLLSKDTTISCSSCHLVYTAFTHVDHDLSHGIKGKIGTRNSPALMNLAWHESFMWDGAVNHLDMQAIAPIEHPAEMGGSFPNVVKKLQASSKYRKMFYEAFGDSLVTGEHLLKALSQFELTLVSANSKYDKVMRKEAGIAFTEQEAKGYAVFQKNCNSCHTEPLFTNNNFTNNGLPVDTTLNDWGRMTITKNPADSLRFKVPTLRNIAFSYPYMHDGRFKKISQVIKHYQKGIVDSPTLAPILKNGLQLTHEDRIDLTAFLLTLSDKAFLFNKDLAFPARE